MTDIPIIFSGPMVRALLDGRKTMTRRLAWKPGREIGILTDPKDTFERPSPWQKVKPGDRLWVRESYRYTSWDEDGLFWVKYLADGAKSKALETPDGDISQGLMERLCDELERKGVPTDASGAYVSTDALKSYPSIHMPRWASRLTLYVTATKIERLTAISADDAQAEGIQIAGPDVGVYRDNASANAEARRRFDAYRIGQFRKVWTSLHGEDGWTRNPEVLALTFAVHKCNIDAMPNAEAA